MRTFKNRTALLQKQITDLYDRLAATTEGSPEQNSVYAELDWLVTLAELDRLIGRNSTSEGKR